MPGSVKSRKASQRQDHRQRACGFFYFFGQNLGQPSHFPAIGPDRANGRVMDMYQPFFIRGRQRFQPTCNDEINIAAYQDGGQPFF